MDANVRSLFRELADASPAERERFYAERAVALEVRAEVESLLAFDKAGDGALTAELAVAASRVLEDDARAGTLCGPYRLIRLIGQGGMGAVYLAERADGEVEQRVAIKFVRADADAPHFRDRFLAERRILASLNHPGIARLIDARHTGQGQPYLVMEYIDGVPIDVYSEKLDLRGILRLFLPACDAVSYAHRNLIIHRDLKPSNILIDASGHPKLLDFGIAKILDAADQDYTLVRVLTPDYASPEQISGRAHTHCDGHLFTRRRSLQTAHRPRRPLYAGAWRHAAQPPSSGHSQRCRLHRYEGASDRAGRTLRQCRRVRRGYYGVPGVPAGAGSRRQCLVPHSQIRAPLLAAGGGHCACLDWSGHRFVRGKPRARSCGAPFH